MHSTMIQIIVMRVKDYYSVL